MLATLLGDRRTTRATARRALRAYDTVRRPFAARVRDCAREYGTLYTLNYPGLTFDGPVALAAGAGQDGAGGGGEDEGEVDEDMEKLADIPSRVRMNWEWEWRTTVDVDVVKALRMLEDC